MNVFIGIEASSEVDHFKTKNNYSVLSYSITGTVEYAEATNFAIEQLVGIRFDDPEINKAYKEWYEEAIKLFSEALPGLEDEMISTFEFDGVLVDFMVRPEDFVLGYTMEPDDGKYTISLHDQNDVALMVEEMGSFDQMVDNFDQHLKAMVQESCFRLRRTFAEESFQLILQYAQRAFFECMPFKKMEIPMHYDIDDVSLTYTIKITSEEKEPTKH